MQDDLGYTAIEHAREQGHPQSVALLENVLQVRVRITVTVWGAIRVTVTVEVKIRLKVRLTNE